MTIKYCDYINGNDSTGDGSYGNPYKTINIASTGLTTGDEVRCAASPPNVTLTGTLTFTAGSITVTGSGTSFGTELVIGDYILGSDGYYYEVITISTSPQQLTLFCKYTGSTQSGVTSQKLGVTSTGEAPATGTVIQQTSSANITISGGWDLATQTQTGQTYFRQMHGTFANRYGTGLNINNANISISKVNFLRCYVGLIVASTSNGCTLDTIFCGGNGSSGITISSALNTLTSCRGIGNTTYGIYMNGACACNVNSCICNGNNYGISFAGGAVNNTLNTGSCIYNIYGVNFNAATGNFCNSLTVNNNKTYGLNLGYPYNFFTNVTANNNGTAAYFSSGIGTVINGISMTGNTKTVDGLAGKTYSDAPTVTIQNYNGTSADHQMWYEYGKAVHDGTNGIRYSPTSATYYCSIPFYFKADSGVGQTINFQTKKDANFNGDMQAAVYFNGTKIVDWAAVTPSGTVGFENQSAVVASNLITDDGVLELKVKARGTTGYCWVNTFTVS
jgi:hypothetical protein